MPTAVFVHLQESIFMSTSEIQKLFAPNFSLNSVLDPASKNA